MQVWPVLVILLTVWPLDSASADSVCSLTGWVSTHLEFLLDGNLLDLKPAKQLAAGDEACVS